jgi:tRNA-dihydrouridine synthase
VPLTVKMRKGIDADHLTFLDAGRIAEDAGVAAVALHARTAAEFYSGHADWAAIAALKQAVTSIPVLGNGDIWSADDAVRMMAETGCDGVVVGRGCLGRPWLFGDLAAAFGAPASAPTRRSASSPPRSAATRSCSSSSSRTRARMPRHPQARRLVLQGLSGRR